MDAHDGKVISATSHLPAQSSSGNDRSQSRISRTRVRNVEMLGPDNALERVPAEQDSATSKGCDSEACSECSVLLKICRSSWRCTGVELVRADSRHSEGERQHWRPSDEQRDPPEWLSSVAVLASASQRSPPCATVSNSPQVGKKGAQQRLPECCSMSVVPEVSAPVGSLTVRKRVAVSFEPDHGV